MRLHAVDATRPQIGVTLVGQEPLIPGDSADLVESAKKLLDADSEIRDLAIVMNSPVIHHHIIPIPSMSSAEREKIIRLEMNRFTSPGEAAGVLSFWPAGKIKENGLIKECVLGAIMPSAFSEALISVIQEKKLNLIGFTTHPQITSHLLKECRLNSVSNLALVEVNEHEGSVTLFHSNIWNMERPFLLGSSAPPGTETPTALDMDKLKLEVGRALQYFKQQVRNENISQIFLYGTTGQADSIKSILESSFRIPVSLMALDAKTFAEQSTVQLLSIPHITALHSNFEKYIDFLPSGWRRKKQIKIGRIAITAAVAALYLLLAGVSYVFKHEAIQIDKNEKSGIQMHQVSTKPAVKIIHNDRIFALAAEQSEEWMHRRHYLLANFARELSSAMPAEMRILSLDAAEKENAWSVKIEVEICSSNGSRSRELFLRFQDRIRTQSDLNHLNWDGILLTDSQPGSTAGEEKAGFRSQNVLTFSMQGSIAINPKT